MNTFAAGTPIFERPRADPYSRNSRIRLLPRVFDGEAVLWPWVKDCGLWQSNSFAIFRIRSHVATAR